MNNILKEVKTYHKNGKLRQNYFTNENNLVDGIWNVFYENGQIKYKHIFHNHIYRMLYSFYSDGRKMQIKTCKQKDNGIHIIF